MKKYFLFSFAVILAIVQAFITIGCGGGSDGSEIQGYSLYGTVQRPQSAANSRVANASGLDNWTATTVTLYAIDDTGAMTGSTLLTAVTGTDGKFYMTMPTGVTPSSSLAISVGSGSTVARSLVSQSATNIDPITETVFQAVTEHTSPLSYFEPAEINQLLTLVSTSTQYMDLTSATSTIRAVQMIEASATVRTKLNANVTRLSASGNQYYSLD